MDEIFSYPLTVVDAPMGYGKTTAVREYLSDSGANILWQRIYDNNTTDFWNGFCRQLGELDDARSQSLIQLGFPNEIISLQEALKIIEDIELPIKTVFVIDDYHIVDKIEVNSFIEFLIQNEITNLYVVLTVRYIALPNFFELKLKGYLLHITQEYFEFSANEIKKYYKLCGVSLKDSDADMLYSLTEGWISALYLLMLNYLEEGSFITIGNIYKLVEKAVYMPFSDEIKEFLQTVCLFDGFSLEQANHMWQKENAEKLLVEITNKNAFIKFDEKTKIYQIHNIFMKFLTDIFEHREMGYKKQLYKKGADWYLANGEYLLSMRYAYMAGDFDILLKAMELDKGHSINSDYKELIIKYVEECPNVNKQNFPYAMLVYARRMFTFNEVVLFKKACGQFLTNIQNMDSLDADLKNTLLGEYQLLLSFTGYNDIEKMSEYHRRACSLLKSPSSILDGKASWTFGSPSVLYMFHRKTGELEKEVQIIKKAMPFYYQITNRHGKGAEYVMEAERYYYMGDFDNAEIIMYQALQEANESSQSGIIICAVFLQIKLAFIKGDFSGVLLLFKQLRQDINEKKWYLFMHTLDMCEAYIYSCLKINEHIQPWIKSGEFKNTRLFFPSIAFLNIIYGRVLLVNRENLKLLGTAEQFIETASFFPNLLGQVYTYIYIAAAKRQIYRHEEAVASLKQALEIAIPDGLYMPFVENCDFIMEILEQLHRENTYRKEIGRILELFEDYAMASKKILETYFADKKPKLTERENEISKLVMQGLTNKEISKTLFISENTIKTQLKSIFEKVGVNSRSLLKHYLLDD
ncbi:MAG TPA: LuxR C-terminal-related transcriptional regulator [Syntrophomonadaceae bacterium]|nr:LuxR C-terminal-related transcriptional regulator [Syntrophomonadaceae bacterium]